MYKITPMNIDQKLADLEKQKEAFEKTKAHAHDMIKELKSKIGKLQTISKHANELFAEEVKEELTN